MLVCWRGKLGAYRFVLCHSRLISMEANKSKCQNKGKAQTAASKHWPQWAQALRDVAFHPEKYERKVLQVTEEAVVYPDLYPKGKHHLLVISRRDGLDSLADVGEEHLPHIQHMHDLAEEWVASLLNKDHSLIFRIGFHSVPSMRQLHMHIISQDFNSPGLKNAKHWNSFTTAFFLDSKKVLAELKSNGKVSTHSKEEESMLLNSQLACHRCKSIYRDIPNLKNHIRKCNAPFPSQLHPFLYSYKKSSQD